MVKLVHISDTHLRDLNVEDGDILIHSGDALNAGSFEELIKFKEQLMAIKDKYKHIIFVPGNHDFIFEDSFFTACVFLQQDIDNLIILNNTSVEIEGIKFYGTPDQPFFYDWAFNKLPDELKKSYANIPEDTQVLITHCPPKGILDYVCNQFNPNGSNVGSMELLQELPRLKQLKMHMFGHIHYSYGVKLLDGVQYSNGAICDERYVAVNRANIIEL